MASETIDVTMGSRKVLASGTDDFKKLRLSEGGCEYVIADKTRFIAELLQSGNEATLITRPPRFMKTTNLSMLKYFFDIENKESNASLFKGLEICEKQAYRKLWNTHQGQYPVVFVSFKDIHSSDYNELCEEFRILISSLFEDSEDIVWDSLSANQKSLFRKYVEKKVSIAELKQSLKFLTQCLFKCYGKKVWVLIDEYDTPMHQMNRADIESDVDSTNLKKTISFFSSLLSSVLKTNRYLASGVMTGVLRTPFASLISPLNNIERYSVLAEKYAVHFGLTEIEVNYLASELGLDFDADAIDIIKNWYNGYQIGGATLYNPWSVNAFLKRYVEGNKQPTAHWLGTGESRHIDHYFKTFYRKIQGDLTTLMTTEDSIDVKLSEQTCFQDLDSGKIDAFWGLLVHCGYLTVVEKNEQQKFKIDCKLKIPNYEVTGFFAINIERCHQEILEDSGFYEHEKFMRSLVEGNIDYFRDRLTEYIVNVASYFDFRKKPIKKKLTSGNTRSASVDKAIQPSAEDDTIIIAPEIIYHVFMLGILSGLHGSYFRIRSNRESGYGRFDLLLFPMRKDMHGIIFEFKKSENLKNLKKEALSALDQIEEKKYYADFEDWGIQKGIHIGISFHGKHFELEYRKADYRPSKAFTLPPDSLLRFQSYSQSHSAESSPEGEKGRKHAETQKMDIVTKNSQSEALNEQLKNWSTGQDLDKATWKFLLPDEATQMQWALSASKKEKHSAVVIKQRKQKMISAAKSHGYLCQDVKEDGNCFFHVIADQLGRLGRGAPDDIDYDTLRTLVAVEVSEHSKYYRDFVAANEQAEFAQKIAEPRVWVGMIAAQAIARIKNVIVVIVPNDKGRPQIMKPPGATEVIVLGNEVGIHFQSLYSENCSAGSPTEALKALIDNAPVLTVVENTTLGNQQGTIQPAATIINTITTTTTMTKDGSKDKARVVPMSLVQESTDTSKFTKGTTTTSLLATLSAAKIAVTATSTMTPMDVNADNDNNEKEATASEVVEPTATSVTAPASRKRTRTTEKEDADKSTDPSEETPSKRAKFN